MRMLGHEALLNARQAYQCIALIAADFAGGDEARGRKALAMLALEAASELPVLNGVIWAQEQAAKGLDLPQRPMRVLCAIGVPQPHSDPANPHVAAPEQPAPSIA